MKYDEDFDVQTKYPVSETPDENVRKLPPIPAKKIMLVCAVSFIAFFAYQFNSVQKEAIAEYKENVEKTKEIAIKDDEFNQNFDKQAWENMFNLRNDYKNRLKNTFFSYLLSLGAIDKSHGFNVEPMVFQSAQQEYIKTLNEYKNYKEPDFSASLGNKENFEALNKQIENEINLMLPIMNFTFEKASNAEDVKTLMRVLNTTNHDVNGSDYKAGCEIIKTKIPDFKLFPC